VVSVYIIDIIKYLTHTPGLPGGFSATTEHDRSTPTHAEYWILLDLYVIYVLVFSWMTCLIEPGSLFRDDEVGPVSARESSSLRGAP
jgi:hypothetical protein